MTYTKKERAEDMEQEKMESNMKEEFNLSEKKILCVECGGAEDVKEFIRLLKEELKNAGF